MIHLVTVPPFASQVNSRKVVDTPVKICLPHELLHCLASTASPFVWSSSMLGHLDGKARKSFFEHIRSLPPWQDNPVFHMRPVVNFEKLIPITIHADGAQFYRNDENFVWSMSSAFGVKGTIKDVMMFKYPIAVIPEKYMRDHHVSVLYNNFNCFRGGCGSGN